MGSNTNDILLRLNIQSKCLAMVGQKWGILIKPLLNDKQVLKEQPFTCDPADVLSAMVSQFLVEKNFDQYLEDDNNYKKLCENIKFHMSPS
jgi:hypothetical protein